MHIPKTGGMTIRAYLKNQYQASDVFPFAEMREAVDSWRDAKHCRLIQGHFRYNMRQALSEGTRIMTILRDPLIRTVSALRHLSRDQSFHSDHEIARGLTLSQMIHNPELMGKQKNIQAAFLCSSAPVGDVFSYLAQQSGAHSAADAPDLEDQPSLDLAIERLSQIDFIGITGQLDQFVLDLSDVMHFHPVTHLPIVNDAETPSTLDALSEDDLGLLRECNELDIELYRRAVLIKEQRKFERSMRALIESGTYRRPPGSFALDMAAPIPGSGWYEAEGDADRAWRWTGPGSRFSLELPLHADSDYRVELGFNTRVEGQEPTLTVAANGDSLDVTVEPDPVGFCARFEVPHALLARSEGFCQILFDLGSVNDPRQHVGQDLRQLGIVVYSVALMRRPMAQSAAPG